MFSTAFCLEVSLNFHDSASPVLRGSIIQLMVGFVAELPLQILLNSGVLREDYYQCPRDISIFRACNDECVHW
jgi:hypothetical protein